MVCGPQKDLPLVPRGKPSIAGQEAWTQDTATNAAATNNLLLKQNQRWAMDFVSDTLANGRPFRSLAIVDEYTRECPAIEVDTSLPGVGAKTIKYYCTTRTQADQCRTGTWNPSTDASAASA